MVATAFEKQWRLMICELEDRVRGHSGEEAAAHTSHVGLCPSPDSDIRKADAIRAPLQLHYVPLPIQVRVTFTILPRP